MFSLGLAAWSFDTGRRTAGFDQEETTRLVDKLRVDNVALEDEVSRLSGLLAASEGGMQIEQAAQKLLTEKNRLLAEENARLKEDLAVFEKISRLEGKSVDEVSLDQLAVRHESQGLYRYSFLIALQGGRRGKESRFDLQVLVSPRTGSHDAMMIFERKEGSAPGQFEVVLRNFRRIDGKFQLPKDYPLGGVEVRILEKGKLKATKRIGVEDMANVQ
ncbi:MAG: hypothetical protein RBT81_08515 [Gammaproteobacteria bacterium]|nr:hypothetical protein [Gammaproteobacteria bacterium]